VRTPTSKRKKSKIEGRLRPRPQPFPPAGPFVMWLSIRGVSHSGDLIIKPTLISRTRRTRMRGGPPSFTHDLAGRRHADPESPYHRAFLPDPLPILL
jgi:hypothetical protein